MSGRNLAMHARRLLAGVLAGSLSCAAPATNADGPPVTAAPPPVAATTPAQASTASAESAPKTPAAWHARYGDRYKRNWGIDLTGVRAVSSGYMLRLSYRIVDPAKAKPLFDKKSKPYVIDLKSGARLAVPAMENIGELRQTAAPVANQSYFIIFGNPGKLVQPGDRVSVVIGGFHADDLIVD